MGFTMDGLKITQRVYVFGQGDKETLAARFAKDVCNPHSQLDHRLTLFLFPSTCPPKPTEPFP